MWTVLVALFGALCWGIAPIFGKMGLARVDPIAGICLRTLIASGIVAGWLLVSGGLRAMETVSSRAWLFIALEAVLATLVGDLAYYAALKWGGAAQVTLVMSTAPLFTLLIAVVYLQESATWAQVIGAVLIVCGLFLVSLGPQI
ncbi:MAG: EamA family transporter [Firmicutes bacterium]|nr:EamA family transporter [Bacillota bacterium]